MGVVRSIPYSLAVDSEVGLRDGRLERRVGSHVTLVGEREDAVDPEVEEAREALQFGRVVLQLLDVLVHILERLDVFRANLTVRVEVEDLGEIEVHLRSPELVDLGTDVRQRRRGLVRGFQLRLRIFLLRGHSC